MDVTIIEIGSVTKAVLAGRLDSAQIGIVETQFTAGIIPKEQNTVIDLTGVTFIASLGIRMLLTVARGHSRRGARMALFGANPAVMEILETTALSDIIPVLGSESEALSAVSA